ncbi:hypothetical protein D3C81_2050980 [compost metagenome]
MDQRAAAQRLGRQQAIHQQGEVRRTHRKHALVHQVHGGKAGPLAGAVAHAHVNAFDEEIHRAGIGVQKHIHLRVSLLEALETR